MSQLSNESPKATAAETKGWSHTLRDDAGNPSSTRVMSILALLAAIALAFAPWAFYTAYWLGGDSENDCCGLKNVAETLPDNSQYEWMGEKIVAPCDNRAASVSTKRLARTWDRQSAAQCGTAAPSVPSTVSGSTAPTDGSPRLTPWHPTPRSSRSKGDPRHDPRMAGKRRAAPLELFS